ncbi:hypothetical protein [Streptomyces cyaneofuscatus]|uniref:hypothetical protein n=1 Tax=Streptomyces cyaneofuscatus TaxID=66883 RepID=UPI003668F6BB
MSELLFSVVAVAGDGLVASSPGSNQLQPSHPYQDNDKQQLRTRTAAGALSGPDLDGVDLGLTLQPRPVDIICGVLAPVSGLAAWVAEPLSA